MPGYEMGDQLPGPRLTAWRAKNGKSTSPRYLTWEVWAMETAKMCLAVGVSGPGTLKLNLGLPTSSHISIAAAVKTVQDKHRRLDVPGNNASRTSSTRPAGTPSSTPNRGPGINDSATLASVWISLQPRKSKRKTGPGSLITRLHRRPGCAFLKIVTLQGSRSCGEGRGVGREGSLSSWGG